MADLVGSVKMNIAALKLVEVLHNLCSRFQNF